MILLFFFFGDDFNIEENSNSFDLDLFFSDDQKIIHIATAGLSLLEFNLPITPFSYMMNIRTVLSYRRIIPYEVNNTIERENLTSLADYTSFFELMAKRGFYSYDKVKIDDTEDFTFQLIAKPRINRRVILNSKVLIEELNNDRTDHYDLNFLPVKKKFPIDYGLFNITGFI